MFVAKARRLPKSGAPERCFSQPKSNVDLRSISVVGDYCVSHIAGRKWGEGKTTYIVSACFRFIWQAILT